MLICTHIGSIIGQMSGFTPELTNDMSKRGTTPRILITTGIILQLPFFCGLFYTLNSIYVSDITGNRRATQLITLWIFSVLLGFGQKMVMFGTKKYAYQCSYKLNISDAYARRMNNMTSFAGIIAMTWSGCYFWFNWGEQLIIKGFYQILCDFLYYNLASIMTALIISLVLPHAPYVDKKARDERNMRFSVQTRSCCSHFASVFKRIFSIKMLSFSILIMPTASFYGVLETVVYLFLFFNAQDKTPDKPIVAMPYMVLIAYFGSLFLIGVCKCNKCFEHSEYLSDSTRRCGAITNFFILLLVTLFVFLGALADNNIIFPDWPALVKNFSLYVITALAMGVAITIMKRQRRSLLLKHPQASIYYKDDRHNYDAAFVIEDVFIIIYQTVLLIMLAHAIDKDPMFQIEDLKPVVFYEIIPYQLILTLAFGVATQVMVSLAC